MAVKKFILKGTDIKDVAIGYGGCIASDMITVHGHLVGTMYREDPAEEHDSGWRFTAGCETEEYMNELANLAVYDVNTIANYDPDIIHFWTRQLGPSYDATKKPANSWKSISISIFEVKLGSGPPESFYSCN